LSPDEFDLLVIPGGGGNTRTYTNFEQTQWKGKIEIDSDVKNAINAFFNAKKPIAVSSHAAILLAKALEGKSIQLAIGKTNEKPVVEAVEGLQSGTKVVESGDASQVQTDAQNRVISVAGYSANANATPFDVYSGAREAIQAVLGLIKK
jgi:enhancing lycopene biosynthesis protein 2